jgi:hypothetical protein
LHLDPPRRDLAFALLDRLVKFLSLVLGGLPSFFHVLFELSLCLGLRRRGVRLEFLGPRRELGQLI